MTRVITKIITKNLSEQQKVNKSVTFANVYLVDKRNFQRVYNENYYMYEYLETNREHTFIQEPIHFTFIITYIYQSLQIKLNKKKILKGMQCCMQICSYKKLTPLAYIEI